MQFFRCEYCKSNITSLKINNKSNTLIDDLTYHYNSTDNKLLHISDAVSTHTGEEADLKGQQAGNFEYDEIGSMTADKIEKQQVFWTVYGKVAKMIRNQVDSVVYGYDGTGNKILRKIYKTGVLTKTVHYVRDASGNTMAMYEKLTSPPTPQEALKVEFSIYGSSRLGTYNAKSERLKGVLGNKKYELSNHLGNVLAVITDNKFIAPPSQAGVFVAQVVSTQDYYAYGLPMEKRSFNNKGYLYSFNGKEDDLESGWQDYALRDFLKKYRRFDSVDPLKDKFPWNSVYAFAENDVIRCIDLEGAEKYFVIIYSRVVTIKVKNTDDISAKNSLWSYYNLSKRKTSIIGTWDDYNNKYGGSNSDASWLTNVRGQYNTGHPKGANVKIPNRVVDILPGNPNDNFVAVYGTRDVVDNNNSVAFELLYTTPISQPSTEAGNERPWYMGNNGIGFSVTARGTAFKLSYTAIGFGGSENDMQSYQSLDGSGEIALSMFKDPKELFSADIEVKGFFFNDPLKRLTFSADERSRGFSLNLLDLDRSGPKLSTEFSTPGMVAGFYERDLLNKYNYVGFKANTGGKNTTFGNITGGYSFNMWRRNTANQHNTPQK
jgi:RHS repeat-associated protein